MQPSGPRNATAVDDFDLDDDLDMDMDMEAALLEAEYEFSVSQSASNSSSDVKISSSYSETKTSKQSCSRISSAASSSNLNQFKSSESGANVTTTSWSNSARNKTSQTKINAFLKPGPHNIPSQRPSSSVTRSLKEPSRDVDFDDFDDATFTQEDFNVIEEELKFAESQDSFLASSLVSQDIPSAQSSKNTSRSTNFTSKEANILSLNISGSSNNYKSSSKTILTGTSTNLNSKILKSISVNSNPLQSSTNPQRESVKRPPTSSSSADFYSSSSAKHRKLDISEASEKMEVCSKSNTGPLIASKFDIADDDLFSMDQELLDDSERISTKTTPAKAAVNSISVRDRVKTEPPFTYLCVLPPPGESDKVSHDSIYCLKIF